MGKEESPEFYIENGLRKVRPYYFEYTCYCKQRWIGKELFHVFSTEFHDKPSSYYKCAIERGKIKVNGKPQTLDYRLKNSDHLKTLSHRHEPPVLAQEIEIIFESEDTLVICKPGGIPMHAAGQYNHNTILSILKYAMGYPKLFIVNRLDRLTSGIVLMGKTSERAAKLSEQLRNHELTKTYVARVKGEFPESIDCDQPILTASQKVGVNIISKNGKECFTSFKRLSYNGRTSLVQCIPKTGRTHQIRVHLQYLGFPIANDPLYCTTAWGPDFGKDGIPEDQVDTIVRRVTEHAFPDETNVDYDTDECIECQIQRQDPIPEQLELWLHAHKYEGPGFCYESKLPLWGSDDFDDTVVEERFWKHGGLWDNQAPLQIL
ncbi:pseudouridine synthase [Gorgonomyces haynaldii]|nr:pseudouridine synthase [Gorgonomyces haynaldii]